MSWCLDTSFCAGNLHIFKKVNVSDGSLPDLKEIPELAFGLQSERAHFVQNEWDAGADIWSQLALKPPQAERTKEKDTEERQGSILTGLTGSFDSAAFSDRCYRNAKKNKEADDGSDNQTNREADERKQSKPICMCQV